MSRTRAAFRLSLRPMFPGIAVTLPISEIDVSEPGRRSQSMMRRGVILLHHGGVEGVRHQTADPRDTDVPGDVTLAFAFRNAEPAEHTRH